MQTIQSNNDGFQNIDGLLWNTNSYNSLETYTPKTTTKKKKKKKNALDYIGDFVTGGVSTAVDFLADVTEGGLNTLEGIVDTGTYALADTIDFIDFGGFTGSFSDDLRKNASFDSTASIFGHSEKESDNIFGRWQEGIEEKSWAPDFVDQIGYGLGNVGMNAALAYVTGGQSLAVNAGITFASSYGNAKSKALRDGLSEEDARKAGFISGAAETISEQFFNGLPGFKSSGWGEKLTGKLANKVTNYLGTNAGKITLKVFDALGEGSEEIISNALTAAGNDIFHYFDKDFTYGMENQSGNILEDTFNAAFSSESGDAFISAAIVSGLLGAGQSAINAKQRNDIIKAYAKDYNMDEKDARYILTGEQLETAKDEIKRDNIEYNSEAELDDMAQRRILNYMKETTHTNVEQQLNDLENDFRAQNGRNFTEEERNARRNFLLSRTEDQVNSPERYREFSETASGNESDLAKSMADSGLADTELNHKLYNFVDKLQKANPNSKYKFVTNDELVKMGILEERDGQYGLTTVKDGSPLFESKTINGFKKGDTIYINSDLVNKMENGQFKYKDNEDVFKYYKTIIGHELGEAIKSSDLDSYNNLKSIVKEIYGETSLDEYKALYGENLTDNVEDEFVNDKLGELFENDKLINKIADDRNLLQKFIDEIKKFVKYMSSSKEQRQLQKLQQKLEDKYVELYKKADFKSSDETHFSLDDDNLDINLNERIDLAHLDSSKTQAQLDKLSPIFKIDDNEMKEIESKTIDNFEKIKNDAIKNNNKKYYAFVKTSKMMNYFTGGGSRNLSYFLDIIKDIKKEGILDPIRFSNETNTIEDGNHRLFIASKLGIKYVPVEFLNFSYEIDTVNNIWYPNLKERIINDRERNRINRVDDRNKDEQVYDSWRTTGSENGETGSRDNRLYNKEQDLYRRSPTKTENSLRHSTTNEELEDSSFSLEEKVRKYIFDDSFYEKFKSEDDSIITESIENIENILDSLPLYENMSEEQKDLFFNLRSKKKALEAGFNNIKDYVINKAEETEIDNYKRNPKLLDEKIKKKKNEINKEKQLREDISKSNSFKNAQFEIIQKNNPAPNDDLVWIRSPKDIKTFDEVLNDDGEAFVWGDYSIEDAKRDLKRNKVTIYSSYPIDQGIFVSTSKIQAEEYAGGPGHHIYSRDVKPEEVAWINGDEGQYANPNLSNIKYSIQESQENENLPYLLDKVDNAIYEESLPLEENQKNSNSFVEKENLSFENDKHGILTKQDYKNKKIELTENYIDKAAKKIEEHVKDVAKRNLALKNNDISELKEIIDKYSEMSREEIYSSNAKEEIRNFVKTHSNQEYDDLIINDDLKQLKKEIRSREFIISRDYAGDFPDGLTKFKKNNPGINIKFGGKGNLDKQIQELAVLYPGQINSDINYGDIPFFLADIMNQNYKKSRSYNIELSTEEVDEITNKIFFGLTNNAISEQDLDRFVSTVQNKIINKYARQMAIKEYRQQAKDILDEIGLANIKDKKRGIQYQINTMKRNLRDIMNQESASKMYDLYFKPISIHNAQIESDMNYYNDKIKEYKLNNAEAIYTQMLGEKKYNPKCKLSQHTIDEFLEKNKSKINVKKVGSAIEEFRQLYDELFERVDNALIFNGYNPIDYRKGYFPHFSEDKVSSKLGKIAEKLGFKIQKGQLPTDIAGITENFNPGKVWTSFSQKRKSDLTDYNVLKGFDNYLRGAMDLIYRTEDIQKLRALEAEIRYQFSEKGLQEKMDEVFNNPDLTNEEKYAKIAEIANDAENGLGNFATELRNYTNALANKKSFADRGMEQTIGRDMYSVMNNVSGRVSANMVSANISSAMTNFIPITQAWSQVSSKNMIKGIYHTIKACIKDDGFTQNSIFLTNRTQQAERLYKTKLDKLNEKLSVPFEAVDSFTSNVIVRSKYFENIEKGMTEEQAIDNADEFAKDVMAGRSKGDSPTIFNKKNPVAKLFTAFQLEVNNQFGYMFKDIKADLGAEAKDKIAAAFLKMFLGAWIYNIITEQITGRKSAFSPIDMAIDDFNTLQNDNLDFSSKIQNIAKDTAQELPFIGGVMGGGRLPIQSAIPYDDPLSAVLSTASDTMELFDNEKRNNAIKKLTKEWAKPFFYVGLPFAGGQIKKSIEGLSMYNTSDEKPIAGSYTDSGRLRFEADTSILGKMQAALFGQYASGNAREYFDKGYAPLTQKQIEEVKKLNMNVDEYREFQKDFKENTSTKNELDQIMYLDDYGNTYWYDKESRKVYNDNNKEVNVDVTTLTKASSNELKYSYIKNLPIDNEMKVDMLNSSLNKSDEILDSFGNIKYVDSKGNSFWYDDLNDKLYDSKYNLSSKNINELTKVSNLIDEDDLESFNTLEELNYSNSNPDKYLALTQVTDYNSYKSYVEKINELKDKYSNSKARKNAIISYINSLNLSKYQKMMLQKLGAGYSVSNYKAQLRKYIESLDLTAKEKQIIDNQLFGEKG